MQNENTMLKTFCAHSPHFIPNVRRAVSFKQGQERAAKARKRNIYLKKQNDEQ